MKQICIVYNPGYAGNFLQRLFSLGHSVAPVLSKYDVATSLCTILSATEKLEKYKFSTITSKYTSWQHFHRETADMYDYHNIIDIVTPHNFSHIFFSIHEAERYYLIELTNQCPVDNFVMLGVSLDLTKYQQWITNSQKSLQFLYRLEEKEYYTKFLDTLDNSMLINLTAMLNSEEDFLIEYRRICCLIGVATHRELAIALYRDWYATRVQCFLD